MKKIISILLMLVFILSLSVNVFADIGPKPSVNISFSGADGKKYFATLLSEKSKYGPWSSERDWVYDNLTDDEKKVSDLLSKYEDTDGYYFIGNVAECTETNEYKWTYYPPEPFKILVYFSESDSYFVSPIYSRYAFDSYYKIDLSKTEENTLVVKEKYDYTPEIISLAARIIATILIELLIAVIFGYREKRLFLFIAAVNCVTQILLNIALNFINYKIGSMAFVFFYILLEIAVFAIEAVIYSRFFKKFSEKEQPKSKAVLYSLIANTTSFALGLWLSHLIPGIF